MDDYVINEYVHFERAAIADLGFYRVDYEPFDHEIEASSLYGHIVLAATQERIHFRQGSHVILVDSDIILDARIKIRRHEYEAWQPVPYISMLWDRIPPEHFLTVSYTIGDSPPPASYIPEVPVRKVAWLKEGF